MRVGIYDPYLDDLGGGEKYMMTIAQSLAGKHEVSVFWDEKKDLDDLLQRFSLDLDRIKLVKNIFSSQVGLVERLQETSKYDAIIVLSDGSIPFVLSKKLFLHLQQPLKHIAVSSWKSKLKLSRVTGVFYNSEYTKSFNEKILTGVKSSVIYPPVLSLAKETKKENIILHVGRFRVKNVAGVEDYKKQSVMIKVFKEMVDHEMNQGWKFVIAASIKEEDKEKFSHLTKDAEGYPIEFFINKSNDALWEIYNKAKIYWHASGYGEDLEKHPEYAEHFGISTVEAMGAGAVPVVINSGGQKEIVTEGKDGLLWDTLSELKEKTHQLIEDKALWNNLSDAARLRAKDFGLEKFYKSVETLIA
jgi:glycosyltransferase involved in cell wall biosynthesis